MKKIIARIGVGVRLQLTLAVSRSSFTLIELLVVIAIISILASLMMPHISRTIETANMISCANNLRQAGMTFSLYIEQSNCYYPASQQVDSSSRDKWVYQLYWAGLVDGNNNSAMWSEIVAPRKGSYPGGIWRCPKGKETEVDYTLVSHYGMNSMAFRDGYRKESTIRRPSRICLIADSTFLIAIYDPKTISKHYVDFRHNDYVNLLFCDGHISPYTFWDIEADNYPFINKDVSQIIK